MTTTRQEVVGDAEVLAVQEVRTRRGFLRGFHPLAKIAGPLPAMVLLLFTRDVLTAGLFAVAGLALVVVGGGLRARTVLLAVGVGALVTTWLAVAFTVFSAGFPLRADALAVGVATALRIAGVLTLSAIGGVATNADDLVRSLVQQLRLPYRFGYGALASLRFVPRFARDLQTIRTAHRVRGVAGLRGPIGVARRAAVPLLASGIRHAERVSMAMDARAFGAHPTRTERHETPVVRRDWLFVVACWTVAAALLACTAATGELRLVFSLHT